MKPSIHDSTGSFIEKISEQEFRKAPGNAHHSDELKELYRLARRQALGVEKAIDELLRQIG
ncbi:MAG: hypothetical protein H0U43_09140 [Chthoniobacterales bacterium]|nr:hypothetical protein [Chthoniobacterales bacterium]